jgi:hypothetical protein
VLRGTFGHRRGGENCIMRSIMICSARQILRGIKSKGMKQATHVECSAEIRKITKKNIGKCEGKTSET